MIDNRKWDLLDECCHTLSDSMVLEQLVKWLPTATANQFIEDLAREWDIKEVADDDEEEY